MRTFVLYVGAALMLIQAGLAAAAQPPLPPPQLPADAPARVREFVEKLRSPDAQLRHDCAKGAAGFRGREAELIAPFLVAMLNDDAEMYGTEGTIGIIIITGRDGPRPPGRKVLVGLTPGRAAVEGLSGMGAPAVGPLLERIASLGQAATGLRADPAARGQILPPGVGRPQTCYLRAACDALGGINDAEAVAPLVKGLGHENPLVRVAAAAAFSRGMVYGIDVGRIGGTPARRADDWALRSAKAVAPLVAALKDDNPAVRATAAAGLGQVLLPKPDGTPHDAIAKEADVPAALDALVIALEDKTPAVRAAVAGALAQHPQERVLKALAPLAQDPDPQVRAAVTGAMNAAMATPRDRNPAAADVALDVAIEALKDPDPDVVHGAAMTLRNARATKAVEPLIAAAESAKAPRSRAAAAYALAAYADPRSYDVAIQLLKDADAGCRTSAAQLLVALKDPRSVDALCAVVRADKEPVPRQYAANALGAIGDAKALPALKKMQRDGQTARRNDLSIAAANAIQAIQGRAGAPGKTGRMPR